MGAITLKNGKVVNINVDNLTVLDWRTFLHGTNKQENDVIVKCTGLTEKEVEGLNYRAEFKPLVKEIITMCQEPLADPNSQSASTTPS
jgi:hypothetical protein